jgi:dienelactone hydrolase
MYEHLGPYSDLVTSLQRSRRLHPLARPGRETCQRIWDVLGFSLHGDQPQQPRLEASWSTDELTGEMLTWSVGYGPRTAAWLLKPRRNGVGRLPAVLALHDHSDFKYFGKEKIAEGPERPDESVVEHRTQMYGGRAFANDLASRGFVVLIHDAFLWGSRRFPLEAIPERVQSVGRQSQGLRDRRSTSAEVALYDVVAEQHEHVVEKYCSVLGTTLAGVVSFEDRVALNYLLQRPEVDPERVACIGLSGGGNRAALLTATHDALRAAVIVGLMTTYEGLLDRHVASHTWMLYPAGWTRYGDWPDVAASRAPRPLLVQYDLDDELFSRDGMLAAHERLLDHYAWAGAADHYSGEFFPGPHKFDRAMQSSAYRWLEARLAAG